MNHQVQVLPELQRQDNIIGTSDTNTVEFKQSASLHLGANRVLGNGDVLTLIYVLGFGWVELAFSNNV